MPANSKLKPHIHRVGGRWYVIGPSSYRGRTITCGWATIGFAWREYERLAYA